MKKLSFVLIVACTLISCTSSTTNYNVQLQNGSIVSAEDNNSRDYKSGDTVCLNNRDNMYTDDWVIDGSGKMLDTVYFIDWTRKDSTTEFIKVESRIGVIK